MRRRFAQYFSSRLGLGLLAASIVIIVAGMATWLLIEGWQLFGEGGSATSRTASIATLAIVALIFGSPFILIFNLASFLVWWAVMGIRER